MKILVFLGFAGFLGALAAGPPLPPAAVDRLGLGVPTDLVLSPTGSFLALATSIGVEIRDPKTLELQGSPCAAPGLDPGTGPLPRWGKACRGLSRRNGEALARGRLDEARDLLLPRAGG